MPNWHTTNRPTLPESRILSASQRLRTVALHCGSYEALLAEAGHGEAVYCDPPYLAHEKSGTFTGYTADAFPHTKHLELVALAKAAAGRGAFVAISNHDNKRTRRLYEDFFVSSLEVRRSVAAAINHRGARLELLVTLP